MRRCRLGLAFLAYDEGTCRRLTPRPRATSPGHGVGAERQPAHGAEVEVSRHIEHDPADERRRCAVQRDAPQVE